MGIHHDSNTSACLYVSLLDEVTILFCFLFEVTLLIISKGKDFFKSPFYCIDLIVIVTSIVFDTEKHRLSAVVQLLIIMRIWRFARIVHGVYMVTHIHTELEDDEPDDGDLDLDSEIDKCRKGLPDSDEDKKHNRFHVFGSKGHVMSHKNATKINSALGRAKDELTQLKGVIERLQGQVNSEPESSPKSPSSS